jgi:hypothetical protein
MNTAGVDTESPANGQKAQPTILKHGFRHPRSERKEILADRGRNGPPEIKGRACTWDHAPDR